MIIIQKVVVKYQLIAILEQVYVNVFWYVKSGLWTGLECGLDSGVTAFQTEIKRAIVQFSLSEWSIT